MELSEGFLAMDDIFSFWAGWTGSDSYIHPADRKVLDRVGHGFKTDCPAEPFRGRLKEAPIVLLFLSPGFHERDLRTANDGYFSRQREGQCDLPTKAEHETAWAWGVKIVRQFGVEYENVRSKIAVLNISPYRSKAFHDWNLLAALPSARTALGWAQTVLFKDAEEGKRTVVCLRSRTYWGLGENQKYGKSLFAPEYTRNGRMHGSYREEVVSAVSRASKL